MVTVAEKSIIDDACKKYYICNYSINDDGSIDVCGNVSLIFLYSEVLPLKFNKVSGYFDCSDCSLTTLSGVPYEVGGYFNISNNWLKKIDHFPSKIGGAIFTNGNNFSDKSYTKLFELGYTPSDIHCREDITEVYRTFILNEIINN